MIGDHVWGRIDGLNEHCTLEDVDIATVLNDVLVTELEFTTIWMSLKEASTMHNDILIWDILYGVPFFEPYIPRVPTSERDEALEEVNCEAGGDSLVCYSSIEKNCRLLLNIVFNQVLGRVEELAVVDR